MDKIKQDKKTITPPFPPSPCSPPHGHNCRLKRTLLLKLVPNFLPNRFLHIIPLTQFKLNRSSRFPIFIIFLPIKQSLFYLFFLLFALVNFLDFFRKCLESFYLCYAGTGRWGSGWVQFWLECALFQLVVLHLHFQGMQGLFFLLV